MNFLVSLGGVLIYFYFEIPYFLDQTPRLLFILGCSAMLLLFEGGHYSRAATIKFDARTAYRYIQY